MNIFRVINCLEKISSFQKWIFNLGMTLNYFKEVSAYLSPLKVQKRYRKFSFVVFYIFLMIFCLAVRGLIESLKIFLLLLKVSDIFYFRPLIIWDFIWTIKVDDEKLELCHVCNVSCITKYELSSIQDNHKIF